MGFSNSKRQIKTKDVLENLKKKELQNDIRLYRQQYKKYEILDILEKVDNKEVYKVLNQEDQNIYCMKRVEIEDNLEKIKKEAETLSELKSEYIVKYYESFEENNYFYIIMEYCETDLEKLIKKCKNDKKIISEELILKYVFEICDGLREIHSKNLIHRDLKPGNLFINKENKIKIGDFGISEKLKIKNKDNTTQNIRGTPNYVAPELFSGIYNFKVDIWALGCIIYELCTLQVCFYSDSPLGIDTKIKNTPHGKIDLDIYDIKLQNVIDVMLEKDYNNRPNIDEVYDYCRALKGRNDVRLFKSHLIINRIFNGMLDIDQNEENSETINKLLSEEILEDKILTKFNTQNENKITKNPNDLIFCIFFYSKKISEDEHILSSLNNKIRENDSLRLIICICEETKEDYEEALSKFEEISCLILNYDLESRDFFIKKYNIISFPTLIILDKNGKIIDSLNSEKIMNFNEKDIEEWKKKFIPQCNNKEHELWERAKIIKHEHELVYSNPSMKPGYGLEGSYFCDTCLKSFDFDKNTKNYCCTFCEYDVCNDCFEKYKC